MNLVAGGGTQLELPPRVRGTSPLFWDWEGPGLNPHTQALVEALADAPAAAPWPGVTASGREALDRPSEASSVPTPRPAVAKAVVQAARPALPELDLDGHDAAAAPVRRTGYVVAREAGLDLGDPGLEHRPVGQHLRLG